MKKAIDIKDYNYTLPDERIAQFPLADRSSSKLLVYNKGSILETKFSNVVDFIPEDSFLIFNNTKVINARMFFKKATGAKIEVFCLEPSSIGVEKAFAQTDECEWNCLVGNASKWRDEILEKKFSIDGKECKLFAKKTGNTEDSLIIKFKWEGGHSFSDVMNATGSTPLPPYIKRPAEDSDSDRYQTVFAEVEGSVAAPTAGLHFTDDVLSNLKKKNITYDFLTLNVGAGTFKPMKTDNVYEHKMHKESFSVNKRFLMNLLKAADKTKVTVGTTSVRTIESLYWLGILHDKISKDNFELEQWEVYCFMDKDLPEAKTAVENLLEYMEKNNLNTIEGSTSLMIVPDYKFKFTDVIITNFHLPASTLLLLVSAYLGIDWKSVYDYALKNDFRFLSYGDSSILIR
ncbi:MAG: S-adenosylmethionine:tRNA ribosyltransferase-isomerase [Ignavibacteria bacterium]